MADPRTFSVKSPAMNGRDVREWQEHVRWRFDQWGIDYPVKVDGIYGVGTRAATASLLYAFGVARREMATGVTPELRTKIRKRRFSPVELARFAARVGYRRKLRRKYSGGGVARPVGKILADSWGYHPGVHDGIDVITPPNATLYAMVKSRVIDARAGGWWGNSPSGDVTKGDGIIQLEVLETVGPFKRGMHIGYGHAEHATVRVGDVVKAGEPIGKAGLAVAFHIHLMVNGGGTSKGIGDRDPRPFLDYAVKHS